jgi:hypothetical protein
VTDKNGVVEFARELNLNMITTLEWKSCDFFIKKCLK